MRARLVAWLCRHFDLMRVADHYARLTTTWDDGYTAAERANEFEVKKARVAGEIEGGAKWSRCATDYRNKALDLEAELKDVTKQLRAEKLRAKREARRTKKAVR
jgi:hypothetical protein